MPDREIPAVRPLLPTRVWSVILVTLLLALLPLWLIGGTGAAEPAFFGALFAAWMWWRSTRNWRAWNERDQQSQRDDT